MQSLRLKPSASDSRGLGRRTVTQTALEKLPHSESAWSRRERFRLPGGAPRSAALLRREVPRSSCPWRARSRSLLARGSSSPVNALPSRRMRARCRPPAPRSRRRPRRLRSERDSSRSVQLTLGQGLHGRPAWERKRKRMAERPHAAQADLYGGESLPRLFPFEALSIGSQGHESPSSSLLSAAFEGGRRRRRRDSGVLLLLGATSWGAAFQLRRPGVRRA